ncbi:unnamed protein product [Calicophoron daubneyi]|uniref:RRM domain-containing protein n=1 Tax=Calicophoron daubneyi TaxID=300641 RepID=A0AAV2TN76_CALDB
MDHLDAIPSPVMHVRNMPADMNEHEIALLAVPFGAVKKMVLSKKNNQALIEMNELEDAMQLIAHYSKYPVSVHGKNVILRFSTHSHLELTSENNAVENAVKNANRIVQQDLSGTQSGNPNSVLRIVIDNIMGQQINHIILYKGAAAGINELAAQLTMLAQQSELTLTPTAAAATASFMTLTSQGAAGAACIQSPQSGAVLTGAALGNPPTLVSLPAQTQVLPAIIPRAFPGMSAGAPAGSTVLIVYNLNEEILTTESTHVLWSMNFVCEPVILFLGVYGDVTRVKIMFNKKDTALIQFTDSQQALTALYFLNGQPLWGKPLKIAVSRFKVVQMPKEDTDVGLTKDYTNSPLHRFRKPNSKNFQNIYPPNHIFHLSNIPPNVNEEEIRALFQSKGFNVSGFKLMVKDKKMALIQLEDVDIAIQALIVSVHLHF